MTTLKRLLLMDCVLTLILAMLGCSSLLFKGVSDSESVEVLQSVDSSNGRIAMLVRRSDHAALSGDTFFVLVTDRQLTIAELRKHLYGLRSVFVAGRDGISIRWSAQNELNIECKACGLTKDIIEKQRFSEGAIRIRYTGFP
jgi:hypothetical protein